MSDRGGIQLSRCAAWFPGGPGDGDRLPQRQYFPASDGDELGGPL